MTNLRKQLYDSIINLLPKGRKTELKKTFNIKYTGIEALKQKKIEVENILSNQEEKSIPVNLNLDTSKKMFGVEVNLEYINKSELPNNILNKEPEKLNNTATSNEIKNFNRRYNRWLESVKKFLANQPIRYNKKGKVIPPIKIEERTFRFSVNRGKINKTLDALKEKFIKEKGGKNYCLIITFIKK
jgi:hypothetical protein